MTRSEIFEKHMILLPHSASTSKVWGLNIKQFHSALTEFERELKEEIIKVIFTKVPDYADKHTLEDYVRKTTVE